MGTAPVAAGSLIAGYALAAKSGARPLGGVVLLGATVWCFREWKRRNGLTVAVALTGVQGGAFVASHKLARRIGAWPSALAMAAVSGAAATAADRAAGNRQRGDPSTSPCGRARRRPHTFSGQTHS